MWHETRKQEREICDMLWNYCKRTEWRQDFFQKIQADPTQFMQMYGRKCQIHLDPDVAAAGDSTAIIVRWQGQQDNLIDRFDVRAHLDYIPPMANNKDVPDVLTPEERQCNYERYRILAQNDFLGITENEFLRQLDVEEQFGTIAHIDRGSNKKKRNAGGPIGYTYKNLKIPFGHILSIAPVQKQPTPAEGAVDSESYVDKDLSIDISKLDIHQAHLLNACGRIYGMTTNDLYSFLTEDAYELRMAREEETISTGNSNDNVSESRSPSPDNSGKITYITSFGGEDERNNLSKQQRTFGAGTNQLDKKRYELSTKSRQYLRSRTSSRSSSRRCSRPRYLSRCNRSRCNRSHRYRSHRYRSRHRRSRSNYRRRRDRRRSSSGSYSSRRRRRSRSRSYDRRRRYSKSRSRSRSKSYKAGYRHRRISYPKSYKSSYRLPRISYRKSRSRSTSYKGRYRLPRISYRKSRSRSKSYQGRYRHRRMSYRKSRSRSKSYNGRYRHRRMSYRKSRARSKSYKSRYRHRHMPYPKSRSRSRSRSKSYKARYTYRRISYRKSRSRSKSYKGRYRHRRMSYPK